MPVRGILSAKLSRVETTTYNARNVDAKAKTLIIEQPVVAQYTVVSPKPIETTANAWRFQMDLPANSPPNCRSCWNEVYDQTYSLEQSDAGHDCYLGSKNKALSDAARRQLEQLRSI